MTGYDLHLRRRLGDILRGGRWVCVGSTAVDCRQLMRRIAEAAGEENESSAGNNLVGLAVFGDDPDPDADWPVLALNRPSSGSFVGDTLKLPSLLGDLTAEEQGMVDAWDPERVARVVVPPLMADAPVAQRRSFGGRPLAWIGLEDKLAIVDLWHRAGIPVAPSRNVALSDLPALSSAHRDLASAQGTVWAVDNSKGLHGGAIGTHRVPDEAAVVSLAETLAGQGYGSVRVMPFLVGVPCSMHGVVFTDRTVPLRPNEMLVFVESGSGRFRYARSATYWDPSPEQRDEMAAMTVTVGDEMRRAVGFRGVFSFDGVMTDAGFRPTEINPRYGVALRSLLPTAEGAVNLYLLNMAVVDGAIDVDPDRFEAWLAPALDANRGGNSFATTPEGPGTSRSAQVTIRERSSGDTMASSTGLLDLVEDQFEDGSGPTTANTVIATVGWSAFGPGGMLNIVFTDGCPLGRPVAPLVAATLDLVDRQWSCGIEPAVPAVELR